MTEKHSTIGRNIISGWNTFLRWYLNQNVYVQLSPVFLFYILLTVLYPRTVLVGDESRYLGFADNLIHGFYSPPYPDINLWNGPGYPVFLLPLVFFRLPFISLRIINAFLMSFALIIAYRTFRIYSSKRGALVLSLILGTYIPIAHSVPLILTECLSWFLLVLVSWLIIRSLRQREFSWLFIVSAALALAALTMTKVIFGYVLIVMLILSAGFMIRPAFRMIAGRSLVIFSMAMLFCVPWLAYTHHITGKNLYWSDSGGMSLYTMSSASHKDHGEWKPHKKMLTDPYHKAFIREILNKKPLERDEALKDKAIENIKKHPREYASNWVNNLIRLFLDAPYHLTIGIKKLPLTLYNFLFFAFVCFLLVRSIRFPGRLDPSTWVLLVFYLVYLGGTSLLSAYHRMFYITAPFWFLLFLQLFRDRGLFQREQDRKSEALQ